MSLGIQELLVCPRPAIGVLSTGDELAAPEAVLMPGKIRDANRPALLAQLGSGRLLALLPDGDGVRAGGRVGVLLLDTDGF